MYVNCLICVFGYIYIYIYIYIMTLMFILHMYILIISRYYICNYFLTWTLYIYLYSLYETNTH
ncbi:hypothetical protein ACMBCM_05585, partial [Spiroplasma sp. K1]